MFSYRVTRASVLSPPSATRIRVWAKPGSRRVEIGWDPWRKRWSVAVLEPALGGRANRAVLAALAERLGVGIGAIRWVHAGSTAAKDAEVDGLTRDEVERRLSAGGRREDDPT